MAGAGGKGKVSNDLVAASCAAVLAVYAAGYWRTRDAARSIEAQAQQRRPAPPASSPAVLPQVEQPVPAAVAEAVSAPPPVAIAHAGAEPPASRPSAEVVPDIAPSAAPGDPVPGAAPDAAAATVSDVAVTPDAAVAQVSDAAPAPAAEAVPAAYWRDGTYTGWGTSRHGDIKAEVVIRDGRIVESGIVSCETRYPCDVISTILRQPVQWQSPDVDRVSRATESADAYYFALASALSEALVEPAVQAAKSR